MHITRTSPESLLDGLALLDAAPPRSAGELARGARLRLRDRLLEALPEGASPHIYWRGVFEWGGQAVVAVGEVHCGGEAASFAVDGACCTLHPAGLAERLVLAGHLAERARRVMADTAEIAPAR